MADRIFNQGRIVRKEANRLNFNTFDKIGITGHNLVIRSLDRMDQLAERAKSIESGDHASIARNMADMGRAQADMYRGVYFVKAHRDLSESMLTLFGIGCRCNCRC